MDINQSKIWAASTPSDYINELFTSYNLADEGFSAAWYKRIAETQTKYYYKAYIRAINSYEYRELCIHKPLYILDTVRDALTLIAPHTPKMHDPFLPKRWSFNTFWDGLYKGDSADDICNYVFVLNPVNPNPFYKTSEEIKERVQNAVRNYDLACLIKEGKLNEVNSTLSHISRLSSRNKARLKLLGVDVKVTGISIDLGSDYLDLYTHNK